MATMIERARETARGMSDRVRGWFRPAPPPDPCAGGHFPGNETDQSFPLATGGYMKWRICSTCGKRVRLDMEAGRWV